MTTLVERCQNPVVNRLTNKISVFSRTAIAPMNIFRVAMFGDLTDPVQCFGVTRWRRTEI
jgi:hypothetical protein